MTVHLKAEKTKSAAREIPAPKLLDILDVDPLQQGQALLAANKNRKKRQKRAGIFFFLNPHMPYLCLAKCQL